MSDQKTDPNLRTIYSPLGEKFEVTPANHIDLMRHAKWTEHKPHPDAVRKHCEEHGLPLPAEISDVAAAPAAPSAPAAPAPAANEAPAPAANEAPAPAANEAPAPAANEAPAPAANEAPVADTETNNESPAALKTSPSDFADMDRDAVRAYLEANFTGVEIDGRKGRDALVAQALELAAARAA